MSDVMAKEPVKSTMTMAIRNHTDTVMELSLDLELITSQVNTTFFGNEPRSDKEAVNMKVDNNEPGFESSMNTSMDVLYNRIHEAILLLKRL